MRVFFMTTKWWVIKLYELKYLKVKPYFSIQETIKERKVLKYQNFQIMYNCKHNVGYVWSFSGFKWLCTKKILCFENTKPIQTTSKTFQTYFNTDFHDYKVISYDNTWNASSSVDKSPSLCAVKSGVTLLHRHFSQLRLRWDCSARGRRILNSSMQK